MRRSTITSRRRTTIPREVCDALGAGPGDKITWEVEQGRVAVTTERPGLWRWKGFIKHGEPDAVKAVAAARKTRGRI